MKGKDRHCHKRAKTRCRLRLLQPQTLKILLVLLLSVTPVHLANNTMTIGSSSRYVRALKLQTTTLKSKTEEPSLQHNLQGDPSLQPDNNKSNFDSQESHVIGPTNAKSQGPNDFNILRSGKFQTDKKSLEEKNSFDLKEEESLTPLGAGTKNKLQERNSVVENRPAVKLSYPSSSNFTRVLTTFNATMLPSQRNDVLEMYNRMEVENPLSCFRRCGENTNFPCSCDEKCIVHKNCCEDLVTTCPQLFNKALSKFRHLLFALVRCDPNLVVFVVESCPVESDINSATLRGNNYKYFSENTPFNGPPEGNPANTSNFSSILEALSNAPVTDYSTGLVFANASIYECNHQTPMENSSREKTEAWDALIGTIDNWTPKTRKDIQQDLDWASISYVPPATLPTSAGALCYNNWTTSCISQVSQKLGLQNVVCNISVSRYYQTRLVLLSTFWTEMLLTQHICASCIVDYQILLQQADRNMLFGFKVIAALSHKPGKVSFEIPKHIVSKHFPWKSLSCDLHEPSVTGTTGAQNELCQPDLCKPSFLLTAERHCRKAVIAEVKIQNEVTFQNQICPIAPDLFFSAVLCFFQSYKLKTTEKLPKVSQEFDAERRVNLSVITSELYFDTQHHQELHFDMSYMFEPFLAAVLTFVKNHCSAMYRSERIERVKSQIQDSSIFPLSIQMNNDFTKEPNFTALIQNNLAFEYCLQLKPLDNIFTNKLNCEFRSSRPQWEILFQKRKKDILRAENLLCLREGSVQPKSRGYLNSALHPSFYLVTAVTLRCLFGK